MSNKLNVKKIQETLFQAEERNEHSQETVERSKKAIIIKTKYP